MHDLFYHAPPFFRALMLAAAMLVAVPAERASAQTADAPETTIDLQEALRLALDRNLSLQQSANDVLLNDAALAQQRASFYPSLNLSAGPSMRFGRSFDQTTAALTDRRSEALSLNASSSINLFNGFADVASTREARLGLEASESTFGRSRQSVLYQTSTQYLQVALNEALVLVEEENLAAQEEQLASIRAAYEAGNRPRADVLQQEAAIAQNEQRLLAARRDAELSKLQLKQTLNLSAQDAVAFETPSDDLLAPRTTEYDADVLVRQALASRQDVTAQRLRIEAAEQGIRVARSGYYPSVSLTASTGTNYSSQNEQFPFRDQLSDLNPNGSVGLSVSIPLFDRGQTKASVERAHVGASNERLALEMLQQEVAYDVEQALLDHRTAQAQLRAAERQLASAEESLRAAEARYDVGASTLLEVTQARSVYVEASTGRIDALYNALLSELSVAFYSGDVEQALTDL